MMSFVVCCNEVVEDSERFLQFLLYSSLKIKRKLVLGRIIIITINYSGLRFPRNLNKKAQDAANVGII